MDTLTLARNHFPKMAGRVVGFVVHAIAWSMTSLLLAVTAGLYPAFVVAIAWGIALAIHGFVALGAPILRARLTPPPPVDDRRLHQRSLEQLSASIAHEIRNPITAAKSLLQQMREEPASPDNAEYARVAIEELDRVERSVSHLLRYARDEDMRVEDLELGSVVTGALEGMLTRIGGSRARVERDLDFDAKFRGDREKLRRIVVNLVENALDALDASQSDDPHVRVSCGRNLAGNEVWLRVRDNGPGIEKERLLKVFEPFHTSKPQGTGLGLAITKKLVEAHGGKIEITSNHGTEVSVIIPAR
jgi:signal transduction histidine kinase